MHSRVLRWVVPVNDRPNRIGGGQVVMVASRSEYNEVEVWTIEQVEDNFPDGEVLGPIRMVQVFGTGQPLPEEARAHLGSCTVGVGLVWHVFEMEQ